MLAYESYIKENRPQFVAAVQSVCKKVLISDPNALMVVFVLETFAKKTGKIDHLIKNSLNYRGLLQFSPANLRAMGYTVETFEKLANYEQVEQVVYKYLKPYSGRMRCLADIYLAVLFPVAIGKPDNFVLQHGKLTAEKVARANPLYDIDKDGDIEVGEVKRRLAEYIPAGFTIK